MKNILILLIILTTYSGFSQSKGYYIVLDGKEVFVEDSSASVVASPDTEVINSTEKVNFHTVKRGENLYSISRLYAISVDDLARLNNFSKEKKLAIGEQLKVSNFTKMSGSVSNASYHIVVKGNTLYSLSKQYGITVEKLKELNNLKSNEILIGQRLKLN